MHVSHVIVSITTIVIGMCVLCAISALGEETVYIFEKVSDDFEVVYVLRLKKQLNIQHVTRCDRTRWQHTAG